MYYGKGMNDGQQKERAKNAHHSRRNKPTMRAVPLQLLKGNLIKRRTENEIRKTSFVHHDHYTLVINPQYHSIQSTISPYTSYSAPLYTGTGCTFIG